MYALANDVERYPEFLSWCSGSELLSVEGNELTARLDMRLAGLEQSFSTRNHNDPGHEIRIQLLDGPFRQLEGIWTFDQLGQEGSRVTLRLDFEFASPLDILATAAFEKLADRMVDDFVARAKVVYGAGSKRSG
jgi:ribosome-associated toxin RatA of RatAB toxin-antitoxin module